MNTLKLLTTSALVVLASSWYASAATITGTKPDSMGRTFVDIKGGITPGDDKTLDSLLGAKPDPNRVIIRLNSGGGNFFAGLNMATSIYEKHLSTLVPNNPPCQ
jgi:hypothetical protein